MQRPGRRQTSVAVEDSPAIAKAIPIQALMPNGVLTEHGVEHELDVLIYATAFDAVDGNYKRMSIRGRGGVPICEHWKDRPSSYLSVATSEFPNLFMILGPNGPFTNLPPTIETEVEWVAELIGYMEDNELATVEAVAGAEQQWGQTCREIADQTLFAKTDSWISAPISPALSVRGAQSQPRARVPRNA